MNELFLSKIQNMIKKIHLNILSWVALALALLTVVFFVFFRNLFLSPNFYLISLFLNIVPFILLVLYLNRFHDKIKATIIIPILFGMIALLKILDLLGLAKSIYHYYFFGESISISNLIMNIIFAISCVLSMISALKGLSEKKIVFISMCIGVISGLIQLINNFSIIRFFVGGYVQCTFLIGLYAEIISELLLYITLLLFSIKYKIPALLSISPEKEHKNIEKFSPEQALKMLKEKLELGMITEEEYQAQRADIISKL